MKVEEVYFRGSGAAQLAALATSQNVTNRLVGDDFVHFPLHKGTLQKAKALIKTLSAVGPETGLQGTFDFQVKQVFTAGEEKLPEAQIQLMQAYVDRLIIQHKITVYKISKSSCGLAWFEERKIKIPRVKDIDTFCVCLHEIGHILNGRIRPVYQSEYFTELQALRLAGLFAEEASLTDCPKWKRGLTLYEKRAKSYVIWHVAKGYKKGLRVTRILPEVSTWLNYDFKLWPGNRVEVKRSGNWHSITLTPVKK